VDKNTTAAIKALRDSIQKIDDLEALLKEAGVKEPPSFRLDLPLDAALALIESS
jgi:hypothetical protein